jgi:IS5 family transposase
MMVVEENMLNNQNIRFKQHSTGSFFGSFLYDQILPKDHFLFQAKSIIDWDNFTNRCLRWYHKSAKGGRPPYEPAVLLRILFLSYLYNISERQIEERVNLDLSFKYFVGLGIDEIPPDHSTLTYFKDRLLQGGGKTAFDELLREILCQAKQRGIEFGAIQIVDATHVKADVNTQKEKTKKKDDDDFTPRDPDASWGAKHQRKVTDSKTGKSFKQTEYFHGYKAHTSVNAKSMLITSIKTTTGRIDDGSQFVILVKKDNFAPIPNKRTYTGDKGYDYGDNHEYLKIKGLGDALKLKRNRTQKKDPNKEIWLKLKETKEYNQGLKERFKVEQIFGEQKQGHGLARCRYLGEKKFHLQASFTAIAHNLKVVVAQMTGTTLKGYCYRGGSPG